MSNNTDGNVNIIHLPTFTKDEPVNALFVTIPVLLFVAIMILICQKGRQTSHVIHSI